MIITFRDSDTETAYQMIIAGIEFQEPLAEIADVVSVRFTKAEDYK